MSKATPEWLPFLRTDVSEDSAKYGTGMSAVHQAVKQQYEKIENQKAELIKTKIIEKGFGHLIDGIEKRTFPKIAAISDSGWTYYYADDDSEEGKFILAVQDYSYDQKTGVEDLSVSSVITFSWQDKISYHDLIRAQGITGSKTLTSLIKGQQINN